MCVWWRSNHEWTQGQDTGKYYGHYNWNLRRYEAVFIPSKAFPAGFLPALNILIGQLNVFYFNFPLATKNDVDFNLKRTNSDVGF